MMYIRSTSDILPKGKDIRNSYIPPNRNDMRNIADITKLSEIADIEKEKKTNREVDKLIFTHPIKQSLCDTLNTYPF